MNALEEGQVIEAWKAAVEVQKHFNTIEMTIRNIFVTLVVAIVAGIGLAFKEAQGIELFSLHIPPYPSGGASIRGGYRSYIPFLLHGQILVPQTSCRLRERSSCFRKAVGPT